MRGERELSEYELEMKQLRESRDSRVGWAMRDKHQSELPWE